MSSFKRRTPQASTPGTRPSPYNSLPLLSLGLAPLDDILGGGLPLSTDLILKEDHPTSYAQLLLKFFIAQGLECGHDVLVVSADGEGLVSGLMGTDRGDEPLKKEEAKDEKMKIAFRYENMGKHATTIEQQAAPSAGQSDVYCSLFDLTSTRSLSAQDKQRITHINPQSIASTSAQTGDVYDQLLEKIKEVVVDGGYLLKQETATPKKALRIAIDSFGNPAWGNTSPASLFRFLHNLRHILRASSASAFLTFPSHLYSSSLLTRLSHTVDSSLSLTSFASDPVSLSLFPRHQGLLHIPKLPAINGLVPPSAKLSVMRGLGGGGEGRENNLGFRVKRRRFVVETVGDEPAGVAEEAKPKQAQAVRVEKAGEVKDRKGLIAVEGSSETSGSFRKKSSVGATIHKQPQLYEF